MARPLTVPIAGSRYAILHSREPLPETADAYIDHCEKVIWISPSILTEDYPATYARAVALAWEERAAIPMIHSTELSAPDADGESARA